MWFTDPLRRDTTLKFLACFPLDLGSFQTWLRAWASSRSRERTGLNWPIDHNHKIKSL